MSRHSLSILVCFFYQMSSPTDNVDTHDSLAGYPHSDFLLNIATAVPSIVVPEPHADLTVPHPLLFNRVKAFLRDLMLRPLVERTETHPHQIHPVMKRLGPALTVANFRLQFDAFWRGKAPFDKAKPLKDGDVLGWWQQFSDHPEAEVLAVRLQAPLSHCSVL